MGKESIMFNNIEGIRFPEFYERSANQEAEWQGELPRQLDDYTDRPSPSTWNGELPPSQNSMPHSVWQGELPTPQN